jgi:threonylcarbamoyladenosine tRNA methylthiotransferase MtaB
MGYQNKIAFHTLGCKLNFSETSSIAAQAFDAGYHKVGFEELADVYVINTCSVTENADKECRYIVRKIKRQAPESKVVIIGCYAQLKPVEISEIEGVDLVLGASEKFNLIMHLEGMGAENSPKLYSSDIKQVNTFVPSFSSGDRTRTFLKVQDGCDYFCSFCTIPLARGRSRSQSISNTMKIIREAISTGVQEIVLTGVNTGDFGKTEDGKLRTEETFTDLIQEIEKAEFGIRFRVSSIEPNLLTNEIIDIVSQSKAFMPHFHIPLQSGSDAMLESMQRKYDTDFYRKKIEYIKSVMPNACIGIDVIVGYPEETQEYFEEGYRFVSSLPASYLHVFTYSERANTRAAKNDLSIPIEIRRDRNKQYRSLSDKLKREFYTSQLNQKRPVLFENEEDSGFMYGYTDNYVRVRQKYNPTIVGSISEFNLNKLSPFLFVE